MEQIRNKTISMDEVNNTKTPIKNFKLPPLKKVTSANNTPLHSPSLI